MKTKIPEGQLSFDDVDLEIVFFRGDYYDLIESAKSGNKKAVLTLVELCDKSITHWAKKYSHFTDGFYDDFVQEGRMAALLCIHKFDPNKNVSYQTFASYHIRKAISVAYKKNIEWTQHKERTHLVADMDNVDFEKHKDIFEVANTYKKMIGIEDKIQPAWVFAEEKENMSRKEKMLKRFRELIEIVHLTPLERDIMNLIIYIPYGKTKHREIADIANLPIISVTTSITSAKKKIRNFLCENPELRKYVRFVF